MRFPTTGILAAAGLGTAMVALLASPAFADKAMDVQMLQTAASIENLAVATYDTALTLDFIGGASAIPVVKAFVKKTRDQHKEHSDAFNAASTRLGGTKQDQPDPVLLGWSTTPSRRSTGPAEVVDLALELENTAASTYVANVGAYSNKSARAVAASIMGVEAQHAAILYAVKALVAAGVPNLIALPPDAAALAGRRRERRVPRRVLQDHECPSRQRGSSAVSAANQDPMPIDERELRSLTDDLDDAHHESLPSMRESLEEWRASDDNVDAGITHLVSTPASRRAFLFGGGALLGGIALAGSGAGGLSAAVARMRTSRACRLLPRRRS